MTPYITLPSSNTKGGRGNSASQELLKDIPGEEVGKELREEVEVVVPVVNQDILGQIVLVYGCIDITLSFLLYDTMIF